MYLQQTLKCDALWKIGKEFHSGFKIFSVFKQFSNRSSLNPFSQTYISPRDGGFVGPLPKIFVMGKPIDFDLP